MAYGIITHLNKGRELLGLFFLIFLEYPSLKILDAFKKQVFLMW